MTTDQKIEEILQIVREERALNNTRFSQLATGLMDLSKQVHVNHASLNDKMDRLYGTLSEDIQVFSQDLEQVKTRVTRLEKKMASRH